MYCFFGFSLHLPILYIFCCGQQVHAGSKTLHQENPPVLNWKCRLTQVDRHNGRTAVVVVIVLFCCFVGVYFGSICVSFFGAFFWSLLIPVKSMRIKTDVWNVLLYTLYYMSRVMT